MCGIAGAIGRIDDHVIAAVKAMQNRIVHRGPDDQGLWSSRLTDSSHQGAAFAFRRLSIIDCSADGHQPMRDPITGNVIVFNGEIYNFQDLRCELQHAGHSFASRSDTEVILKAYQQWGTAFIEHLRGMFALALWNHSTQTVLMARDRLGIKPLYWTLATLNGGARVVLFASEVRALLASGLVARELHEPAVASCIWNGFVAGPQTIVKGVYEFPAANIAEIQCDSASVNPRQYWRLPQAGRERNTDQLDHAFRTAAKQHLLSDVPLGVFLSGGIDSSSVTALAVEQAGCSVRTFNVSFAEQEFDESPHARAVASALGTDHTEVRLDQLRFREQLPEALDSADQPSFDGINTYFVSRAVREAGITVALTGTGGDELFGGYRSFVDLPRACRISRNSQWMPAGIRTKIGQLFTGSNRAGDVPPQTRWGKMNDVLTTTGELLDLYQIAYGLFTADLRSQLLGIHVNGELTSGIPSARYQMLRNLCRDDPMLHAISMLELSLFIGDRLLRDTDAASMAVSIEVRLPLLDHEVVEAAAAIDPAMRFQPLGSKALLKKLALRQLDPKMFERPKSGFVLPIERWCRQELRDELENTFRDRRLCESVGLNSATIMRLWQAYQAGAKGLYRSREWSLFALLRW
jgi:asparagine synthase (glutamine-hydrolysing)